jgi:hypothetical protein
VRPRFVSAQYPSACSATTGAMKYDSHMISPPSPYASPAWTSAFPVGRSSRSRYACSDHTTPASASSIGSDSTLNEVSTGRHTYTTTATSPASRDQKRDTSL